MYTYQHIICTFVVGIDLERACLVLHDIEIKYKYNQRIFLAISLLDLRSRLALIATNRCVYCIQCIVMSQSVKA